MLNRLRLFKKEDSPPEISFPPDISPLAKEIFQTVQPYTMVSIERVMALVDAVKHVVSTQIPGDIVECGVWRGGCMMAVAMTLQKLGVTDRKLYLFDTYEGMPPPTDPDRDCSGRLAADLLKTPRNEEDHVWAYCDVEKVRSALLSTGYPESNLFFVKGKVEDTVPEKAPTEIALLRLDTDWYESTYHEMIHLYPRLKEGGVLIIDDYGHWEGCRRAVDQYLRETKTQLLLCRTDYTGRIAIKPQ